MLYYLTWKAFGLLLASLLSVYYFFLWLFFRRSADAGPALPPGPVIGPARADDTEMHLVSCEELDFAGAGDRKVMLLGGLADLMQELKILVRVTIEENDSRDNFLSLLRLLLQDHPRIAGGTYYTAVTEYLLEQPLPFPLSQPEIENILNETNHEN